jgi:DNA-binding winged helix-turn-helix (wHTH) protein/Tfp pilus assembly protein PilF
MSLYEFGPFQLDEARLLLLDRGIPTPIGPKVVETLLALVEHPGELFSKSELLARIWPEGYVDEANLAQNVYVLRKTLRRSWNVEAIETIPRRGYRFAASVGRREDPPRPEPAAVRRPQPSLPRGAALAAAFALALLVGSAPSAQRAAVAQSPARASAQDARLYAIGRYYWNLRTRDGVAKSLHYFSRIVADDPQDARGYAGLASANAIMADYKYGSTPPKVDVARANVYARRALALDAQNAEAYAVLGFIASWMKGGYKHSSVAVADFRRAIALDPSNGTAHQWYGTALLQQGRVAEAYAELTKAAQLDPLSVATTAWLGTTAYYEGHYRDAIAFARETLDLSPQRPDAYETLGLADEAIGDRTGAAESFRHLARICAECRAESAALLTELYARSNRIALARAELAIARANVDQVEPQNLAIAFEALGERGAALTWLRRARSMSGYAAAEIATDPRFAALRRASTNG